MKYKTKLFVVVISLIFVANGLLLAIFYHDANKHLRQEVNLQALGIAATAAASIDGDELATLKTRKDEATPIYKKYENLLRKIRDNNFHDEAHINYIYTLTLNPANSRQFLFGVDAEEPGPAKSHVGDIYNFETKAAFSLNKSEVQTDYVVDQWGEWLTAHVPIYDKQGQLVGAVAVDIDSKLIADWLEHVLLVGYLSLALSLLVALVLTYFMAKHCSQPLETINKALRRIGKGDLKSQVAINTKDEFAEVGAAINIMTAGLQQRDTLKTSLARYVSTQVAEKIIESGCLPEVQGERRKVTVLFCDIRNFTLLAESLPPERVVSLLNEAFEHMIEAIFEYHGMLDKFLGDGFMAIFGAPLHDTMQEEHAINAALAMQLALNEVGERWLVEHGINFRMGIGINTGMAIVGNMGSKQRMEYTAIGDTVNLAASLEAATKELGSLILLSEHTYKAVANKFAFKSLGALQVKGRQESVIVYEVFIHYQAGK